MTKRDKCLLLAAGALFLAAGAGEMYMDRAEDKPPQAVVEAVRADSIPVSVGAGITRPLCQAVDGEDPAEEIKITAALEAQGYFRPDVPLSYDLQDNLHTACETYGVPYELALGLIQIESNFDPEADNGGCYGLCQLSRRYFSGDLTPVENIRAGMEYLGGLLNRYGDTAAALTAYNAGHDNGSRSYANRVLAAAEGWGWE